jgi:branched-chain amino acid transport system permease protein
LSDVRDDKRRWLGVFLSALAIGAIAFGFVANNYLLQAGTSLAMYMALAYAWNIVGGYMGYPSFGTAAFFGLGAYLSAIAQGFHAPLVVAWLIAALGAAIFSAFLGSILLRMRGHYFAIGTIAALEVMREVANNWEAVTGGATGLNLPIMAGTPRAVGMFYYFVMCGAAALTLVLTAILARSKFSFALRCIKQNEQAARTVGIDTLRTKVLAFVLSSVLMSVVGAIYASMVSFIDPDDAFNILMSISVPVIVTLGGAGLLLGPLVGTFLYMLVDDLVTLHFINYHMAVLGFLIVAIIYFVPRGLIREISELYHGSLAKKIASHLPDRPGAA